jgi:hypothetical protein
MTTYTVERYDGEKTQFEFLETPEAVDLFKRLRWLGLSQCCVETAPQRLEKYETVEGRWISSDSDLNTVVGDILGKIEEVFGFEVRVDPFRDDGVRINDQSRRGRFLATRKRGLEKTAATPNDFL